MHIVSIIEQALLELNDELLLPSGYKLEEEPDGRYIYLKDNYSLHLMMIMVTDNAFWLYRLHGRGRSTLLKQLRIECPTLVDEIQDSINNIIYDRSS